MYRGYFFDVDGTLVTRWTPEILPGVKDRLADLRAQGATCAFVTNQAGPSWRAATQNATYPTAQSVAETLVQICTALPPDLLCVCVYDERIPWPHGRTHANDTQVVDAMMRIFNQLPCPVRVADQADWRKPEPGMITYARHVFDLQTSEVLFVGDMESDRAAAARAGVAYCDAQHFFGG